MIDSRRPQPGLPEGFTGGAAWRSQALRVVQTPQHSAGTTVVAPQPAAHTAVSPVGHLAQPPAPVSPPAPIEPSGALLRSDRTFAQHGLLGSPDALVVRVAIEGSGAGAFDIQVAFAVPDACGTVDCSKRAGWYEPSDDWTFTVTCHEGQSIVVMTHAGFLAPREVSEATFRMVLSPHVDLRGGMLLRTAGLSPDGGQQPWSGDLSIRVERLGL